MTGQRLRKSGGQQGRNAFARKERGDVKQARWLLIRVPTVAINSLTLGQTTRLKGEA